MPRSYDKRVEAARKNRNERVRKRFAELFNKGLRYEVVMEELIKEFSLSEGTLSQIINEYGKYSKKE